jgi:hypothetical protein
MARKPATELSEESAILFDRAELASGAGSAPVGREQPLAAEASRAAAKHDVAFGNKEMMVGRGEINLAIPDDHAAFGLNDRKGAGCARNGRQDARALRRYVENHENRGRKVNGQTAKDLLQRSGGAG